MLRTRATLLALPALLVGAFALQQDPPAVPVVSSGAATALEADFERLEGAWWSARLAWLAAPEAPASGDPADAEPAPDAEFARAFEQLAAQGSGPAALWCLLRFREAHGLGADEAVPADARVNLLDVYSRLVDEHADDVDLLVPDFFDRLTAERDLTDYEVDEICARLEMAGRDPEVQARSLLARAERAAPLGCEDPLQQAIAGILLDRVLTEYPTTSAFVEAVDARWRLDHLSVGRTPPAFTTADLVGNEIALGDLRGRVVIVSFLGAAPGDSQAGIARSTELRRRYWDDRFSWIGVHEHPDPDAVELLLQEPDVLGTHAYEGTESRPAIETWRVDRRPMTLLLDGQGQVRAVDLEGEALDERIHLLLEELGDVEEPPAEVASGPGLPPPVPSDPSPGGQVDFVPAPWGLLKPTPPGAGPK